MKDVHADSSTTMATKWFNAINLLTHGGEGKDLTRADLEGTNLSGAKLAGATLREANLRRAMLRGADLRGADLSGADASGACFSGSSAWDSHDGFWKFHNIPGPDSGVADLTDANLSQAVLKSADLTGSNLERSSLRKAIIGDTLLDIPPHWRWSKFATEELNRHYGVALLNHSNLGHADLFGAKLICVLLEDANLVSANLSHADLRRSYLAGCRFDDAVLEDADLREASFSTAFGSSAVLAGSKLRRARLTTEGEGAPHGGFLELAACNGLETAEFDSEEFLGRYLGKAWHYLHQSDIAERSHYPDFLTVATDRIRALRFLYADDEPPDVVVETITSVNLEVLAYLRTHQDAVYRIGPLVFEQLVAELLAHFGWEVSLTRGTKDGGFDIFAISRNQAGVNTSWLIECKRFGPDRPVGVSLVRALYGTKVRLGVAGAMLATTSSFTKGAKEFAGSTYDLSLKDYNDILDWVNAYRPNSDGRLYIRDDSLIVPGKPVSQLVGGRTSDAKA